MLVNFNRFRKWIEGTLLLDLEFTKNISSTKKFCFVAQYFFTRCKKNFIFYLLYLATDKVLDLVLVASMRH